MGGDLTRNGSLMNYRMSIYLSTVKMTCCATKRIYWFCVRKTKEPDADDGDSEADDAVDITR